MLSADRGIVRGLWRGRCGSARCAKHDLKVRGNEGMDLMQVNFGRTKGDTKMRTLASAATTITATIFVLAKAQYPNRATRRLQPA